MILRTPEFVAEFLTRSVARLRRGLGAEGWFADERLRTLHDRCLKVDPATVLKRPLAQTRFVVLDTETTGFHAYAGDEIVSIACLELRGDALTGREFATLVNPNRPIPPTSTEIHGITDEDVRDSPKLYEIFADLIEFIDDGVIVGHHINFDLRFINKTMQRHLLCRLRNPWLDTMLLFTAHTGRIGHYDLDQVARACGVTVTNRHTAVGDARATAQIFTILARRLISPNGSLGALIKAQNQSRDTV